MLFMLVSCNNVSEQNHTIQIWSYDYDNAGYYYNNAVDAILSNAKFFCEKNEIPFEIVRYNSKTLSYDNYILKRNTAAANGNMIIIEDARYLSDISKQHADYSKLEYYDKLFSVYKDKYCIPLGVGYGLIAVYNNAVNYYGIDMEKPIITYNEYLEIKQQMKEQGARFKLNMREYSDIIDYYLIKNSLKFINNDSEILKDNIKFKESIYKTITGICDDIVKYSDDTFSIDDKLSIDNYKSYDKNTELILFDYVTQYFLTSYGDFSNLKDSILNTTFAVFPNATAMSPCFYMYKNITNDKIYELANYIVNDNSYLNITGNNHLYSPTFNTEKTRKLLELNDNWEYNGIFKINSDRGQKIDTKINNLINDIFEMLVKNEETSKLIASYYYVDIDYSNGVANFVNNLIQELSIKNFEYTNEETNKMIDDEIDKFINNFKIHYN